MGAAKVVAVTHKPEYISMVPEMELIVMLRGMVPTYHAPEEINREAAERMAE